MKDHKETRTNYRKRRQKDANIRAMNTNISRNVSLLTLYGG